jgi:hypothetical protein
MERQYKESSEKGCALQNEASNPPDKRKQKGL